jgi:hypothetical protein
MLGRAISLKWYSLFCLVACPLLLILYKILQSVKDAMAFYSRKMGFVKESMDKLEITINQKQDQRGGTFIFLALMCYVYFNKY